MNNGLRVISLLLIIFTSSFKSAQTNIDPDELYLGETPPGNEAELFRDGFLVEHPLGHKRSFNLAFSPMGDELFFSYYKGTEEKPHPEYEIKTFKFIDGKWGGPTTAPFSGTYSDVDISFSPNGNYLFFASGRPPRDIEGLDICIVKRTESGWSEPVHAGTNINTDEGQVMPSLSEKGNLFYRSDQDGNSKIYKARWRDGKLSDPIVLPATVNTEHGATDPCIARDESYLLFDTMRDYEGGVPQIYISFQIGDNVWTESVNLGPLS